MKKLLTALALSAGLMGSAHASSFIIGNNPTPTALSDAVLVAQLNDFNGTQNPGDSLFSNAGDSFFCTSCTLTVDSASTIAVYLIGSESSDFDSLWSGSTPLASETDGAGIHVYGTFPIGVLTAGPAFGTQAAINAALAALIFKVDVNNSPGSANAAIGTPGFGIFYNPSNMSQVILAFDDSGGNPEDNHDDLLVRVTLVPEPAAWAFMIMGFAGLAMARRRSQVRA